MTGSLKDLAQDIFGHALVETADVQRTLVRLGRGTSSSTGRRQNATVDAGLRRSDRGRDRVVVGRNLKRRRLVGNGALSVLRGFETRGASRHLRRRHLGRVGRTSIVSHYSVGM